MTRTLRIQEQFRHAKVFETKVAEDGTGLAHEACIATFDNRADADLFVAIATAEVKYQVEMLVPTAPGWANVGHVPTTNLDLAYAALRDAEAEDKPHYPNRVRRLAIVRTISEAALPRRRPKDATDGRTVLEKANPNRHGWVKLIRYGHDASDFDYRVVTPWDEDGAEFDGNEALAREHYTEEVARLAETPNHEAQAAYDAEWGTDNGYPPHMRMEY